MAGTNALETVSTPSSTRAPILHVSFNTDDASPFPHDPAHDHGFMGSFARPSAHLGDPGPVPTRLLLGPPHEAIAEGPGRRLRRRRHPRDLLVVLAPRAVRAASGHERALRVSPVRTRQRQDPDTGPPSPEAGDGDGDMSVWRGCCPYTRPSGKPIPTTPGRGDVCPSRRTLRTVGGHSTGRRGAMRQTQAADGVMETRPRS